MGSGQMEILTLAALSPEVQHLCVSKGQMFPFPKMSPFCSSFTYMPTLGINLYWKGVCGESPDQILWGPQSWNRRTPCSQGLHGIFGEIR